MSAKLLQLANSAYFGTGQVTTSIVQAIARLGTDRLRYLVLSDSAFSSLKLHDATWFALQDLQRGSMHAARLAQRFAEPTDRDDAFASALLHDLGHVVLALGHGPEFQAFHERAKQCGPELDRALELDLFGVTHAEVGAHLLSIWGLPSAVVDAVGFHHDPGSAPESCRRLACMVHVADAAVQHLPVLAQLNADSLERAGCAHLVPSWLALAKQPDGPAPFSS